MYSGEHDPGKGYTATYRVPENGAFWSITVYGDDGHMKSENAILNSSNAKLNADGTFTVFFGLKESAATFPTASTSRPVGTSCCGSIGQGRASSTGATCCRRRSR